METEEPLHIGETRLAFPAVWFQGLGAAAPSITAEKWVLPQMQKQAIESVSCHGKNSHTFLLVSTFCKQINVDRHGSLPLAVCLIPDGTSSHQAIDQRSSFASSTCFNSIASIRKPAANALGYHW